MKKIFSKILGEVEVDEKERIHFPEGILGFEGYNYYYLLNFDEDGVFHLLQAEDDADLCFVVIFPQSIFHDYKPDIHKEDLQHLDFTDDDEFMMIALITIPEDMKDMTANLQGPVVINPRLKRARQCIAMNDEYTTKHKVLFQGTSESASE